PQMLNQKAERQMLGYFDGALDCIHRLNPHPLFRIDNVERWCSSAPVVRLVVHWRMDGVKPHIVVAKPGSQLTHMLPPRVVKMLPGSKDFDRLRAATHHPVEQTGMNAAAIEDIR